MIDTHVHLDRISSDDISGAMERAHAAQVTDIVTVGMDPISSREGVALARRFDGVYSAVGIHPWEAARNPSENAIASLRELAKEDRVVAIGEIGLDYENNLFTGESYRGEKAREIQRDVFRFQLQVATELNLPAIIHSRGGAHRDVAPILEEAGPAAGTVIQFLSGTPRDVSAYAELGCYLSVGGPTTDPRETDLREAVQTISLDRLVLETDSPYVPPVWKGDAPSEPADISTLCAYLAALINIPTVELVELTTQNARNLYRLS